ncbi:MAG: AAA family ATPase [Carboxydocellales bacterium]
MKPLRLKIEGLQSFREAQEIDFTTLCDTGVFGIFGPTGSGKSTILDAITLALYGKVERANKNTQGIINHGADKVLVEFSFEIGVPGQKRTYLVERLYKRVGDNNVNARSSRISELTPAGVEVLADKDREVTLKVQEIIGLTVEDFTRAVVLPQGKFSEFLALRDADRRKMLQRLFALEAYGDKLNERLKKRLNLTAFGLNGVVSEQLGLGDASTSAVEAARQELSGAKEREKTTDISLKSIVKEYEVQKVVWELQGNLQKMFGLENEHKMLQGQVEEQEQRLDKAVRAELVRPLLIGLAESEQQRNIVLAQQQQTTQLLQTATVEEVRAQQALNDWQQQRQLKEPQLIRLIAQLETTLLEEKELTQLNGELDLLNHQVQEGRNSQQQLNSQRQANDVVIQSINAQLTKLKQRALEITVSPEYRGQLATAVAALREYHQITARLQEASQEAEAKRLEVEKAQEALSTSEEKAGLARKKVVEWEKLLEVKQTACPATEEDLLKKQQAVERGKPQLAELERVEQEIAQALIQVGVNRAATQQWELALTQAEEQLKKAVTTLDNTRMLRDELNVKYKALESQNLAAVLVQQLQAGQPCPVCGSTEHSALAQPWESSDLGIIQAELKAAETACNLAQTGFEQAMLAESQAKSKLQTSQNQLEQCLKLEQEKLQQGEQVRGNIKAENRGKTLLELRDLLVKLEAGLAADKLARQGWLASVEQLQQELNSAKFNLAELEKQHSAAENSISYAQKVWREAGAKQHTLAAQTEERLNNLQRLAALIKAKLCSAKLTLAEDNAYQYMEQEQEHEHEQDTYRYLEQEDKLVAEYDREAEQNKGDQEAHQGKLTEIAAILEVLEVKAKSQELELARQEAKAQELTQQVLTKKKQIHSITAGRSAQDLLEQTGASLNQIVREEAQAKQAWEIARSSREKGEQAQAAAARELEVAEQTLTKARDKLGKALQQAKFSTAGEAEQALCPTIERQEMEKSIKAFRDQETALKQEKQRLESSLAGRILTAQQWEEWQSKKVIAEEQFTEATRQGGIAEARLKELENRHLRWQSLEQERGKLVKLKDQLETLQRIFRGNGFVEYIAEEQVVNVALAASARLKQMTRHRYGLEVDSEGGFIMRDDANGGVKRPVSTLSGGETFLTALALALALSAQIQLKGQYPLEFFFLDEGFGTLDSELLDKVMTTLEDLPADRMTIGVISHVPEMRHRMARRLVVEPAQPGGLGSQVKFEIL